MKSFMLLRLNSFLEVANKLVLFYIDRKSVRGCISFDEAKQSDRHVFGLYSIFCEILLVQTSVSEDKSKKRILFAKKYRGRVYM
jgi:hypothetical protein